ncbi:MAG TPA: LysR family transcriptional regulator [Zoogloea sp.]|uniref:LysR family transcriptional regulator n=1 Tax=Zoogloea sp. TaxID=49181 RepID=UPI002D14DF2B|nr:LysR family transcriptional regulator [Zoogloea sp.]HMV63927.1 LysR family transcriptional regulator [Rhodocyclaceae bacterium]HMW52889.1 LysR family transcriptional regulator [Rhodocyclaceae bacterium]HNA67638.1 LysR family transcriptional regulator [Rhodocyclaceae bacterium]HNC79792.1 LysR family transcriptional regulator [Rhodocyclaceae bacterium]HND23267.1 LysR family transcriptional regulator [Rhodocyclaceae bacterium]
MDLRALRYFIETVRQGSFTVAAERLCVTQSTVSKMLRQLEDEVGQPLLHRDGRRIRVTDVGRILFDRGQEALGVMRELNREVADLTALARGELTVGLPPTVNLFFTPVVKAFRERHPGVRLTLVERGGQIIEQQVASGELEVGVTLLPVDPALGLATRTVGRHPIVAVGPADALWARQAQVDLSHLDGEALVLLHDDFALTRQLRDAFRRFGVEPRIVAQSGQWDFLVALAAAGLGTALLPQPLLARMALHPELAVRPLADPALAWTVAHIWPPGRYLSHAARAWLAVCEDVLDGGAIG